MLLPLSGRRLYYDLTGPEDAPTICITHSLASDGGSWAEQVPALLAGGFRVLRLDMRGHGGSDPVAGDYEMAALADEPARRRRDPGATHQYRAQCQFPATAGRRHRRTLADRRLQGRASRPLAA